MYSPDGKVLAVCGGWKGTIDRDISLWETATGTLIRRWGGHRGGVSCVAFSPDGRLLASAAGGSLNGEDRTARVWDVLTGKELRRFEGHKGTVLAVAFSPDGKHLASSSTDTTILIWDVSKVETSLPKEGTAPKPLTDLWSDLAESDAGRAYPALVALAARQVAAVAFLRDHLRPVPQPEAKRVQKLLDDLDSELFATRDAAFQELMRLGKPILPALRDKKARTTAAEVRKRLSEILSKLEAYPPDAHEVRQQRAIRLLELVHSAEARALLKELASGAPGAPLTRDARLALGRLERRHGRP